MFDKFIKKTMFAVVWLIELLVLLASLFVFASTIQFFPWYEPLTMVAYFVLGFLELIQLIIMLVFLVAYKNVVELKINRNITIISMLILTSVRFMVRINEVPFNVLAIVYAITEVFLIVFWIYPLIIKLFKRNTSITSN